MNRSSLPVLAAHRRGPRDPRSGTGGTPPRRRPRAQRGVTLIEFAIAAPVVALLLLGLVVASVVVMNIVQLNNVTRDAARAAAACGGSERLATTAAPPGQSQCTYAAVVAYASSELSAVNRSGLSYSLTVYDQAHTAVGTASGTTEPATDPLNACREGYLVELRVQYDQPLYVPAAGSLLGNASTNTRHIDAMAEATCEQ